MRLIYEQLVRDYLDSLQAKLRNFSVEPEFLATWVHDEDDATSLYELFAAAREAGCRELTIVVGAGTAARLDRAALGKRLAALGRVRLEPKGDGLEIVGALEKAAPSAAAPRPAVPAPAAKRGVSAGPVANAAPRREGTHPAYKASIARLSASPEREGAASAPTGGLLVEAEDAGAVLSVAVGADGVVVDARHRGAQGELRGLLEGVCGLLPGRTFQEGHDHAVIRLEARLRDRSVPPPADGVVTPRNADPVFARPVALVRAAYAKWLAESGAKPAWNFWDDQPAESWRALTDEEKLRRAKDAVLASCRDLGIPETGIEVLELLSGCRVVLAASPETIKPAFAPRLLALERAIKSKLDPRIEVQLESLEDRNRRAERTQRTEKLI